VFGVFESSVVGREGGRDSGGRGGRTIKKRAHTVLPVFKIGETALKSF